MQDRREYLIALGLAKPGRGRFSRDAIEALKAAEASGTVFLDKGTPTREVTVTNDDGTETVERKAIDPFAPTAEPIRAGMLTFVNGDARIAVNSSEACNHCRMSFGWCYCPEPSFRYWKDSQVYTLKG